MLLTGLCGNNPPRTSQHRPRALSLDGLEVVDKAYARFAEEGSAKARFRPPARLPSPFVSFPRLPWPRHGAKEGGVRQYLR